MGTKLFDQYSLLHFSVGVIAYFVGIGFAKFFILHMIFEIVENSAIGMEFINSNFSMWPGGKPYADSLINSIGDQIAAVFGWLFAYQLDKLINENK